MSSNQIGGVKMYSFLNDTSKLLKEGYPRKVIRQFLLLKKMVEKIVDRESQNKLYHQQIHANMRILKKYWHQHDKRNYSRLKSDLVSSLTSWIKFNSEEHTRTHTFLFAYYIIHTGLILINNISSIHNSLSIMELLSQFEFNQLSQATHPRYILLKIQLHFRYAQLYLKFDQQHFFVFLNLRLTQAETEYLQVISLAQAILPIIYPKKCKIKIDIKSELGKLVAVLIMTFYQLSFVYEYKTDLQKLQESLNYSLAFNYLLKQQVFNSLIQNRINYFSNQYSEIILELNEINQILSLTYQNKQQDQTEKNNECLEYNNSQLFSKYNYAKLNKVQYFKLSNEKVVPQSLSSLNRKSTLVRPHFSPIKLSHAQTMSEFQSTTIGTTSRQDSAFICRSLKKIQKEPSEMKIFFSEDKPSRKISQIQLPAQNKWIKIKTDLDKNLKDPLNQLTYIKLEKFIRDKVTQQMNRKTTFDDISTVNSKVAMQLQNENEQSDKADFMIKQLGKSIHINDIQGFKKQTHHLLGRKDRVNSYLPGRAKYQVDIQYDNCDSLRRAKNRLLYNKERRGRNQSMSNLSQQKREPEQSFLKKARNIILKHANQLNLQSLKKELKKHNSFSETVTQPIVMSEKQADTVVLQQVQKKNEKVLRLLMDEYEDKLSTSKTERKPRREDEQRFSVQQELGESTYCNFMNDKLKKSSTFIDMAFLVYQTLHQKNIKK